MCWILFTENCYEKILDVFFIQNYQERFIGYFLPELTGNDMLDIFYLKSPGNVSDVFYPKSPENGLDVLCKIIRKDLLDTFYPK